MYKSVLTQQLEFFYLQNKKPFCVLHLNCFESMHQLRGDLGLIHECDISFYIVLPYFFSFIFSLSKETPCTFCCHYEWNSFEKVPSLAFELINYPKDNRNSMYSWCFQKQCLIKVYILTPLLNECKSKSIHLSLYLTDHMREQHIIDPLTQIVAEYVCVYMGCVYLTFGIPKQE